MGKPNVDKLGILIVLIALGSVTLAPFVAFKANRIVQGQPVSALGALPTWCFLLLLSSIAISSAIAALRAPVQLKAAAAFTELIVIIFTAGIAATHLAPEGNNFARVSVASGFWILLFAFALMLIDALAKLKLSPLIRLIFLCSSVAIFGIVVGSGSLNGLSLLKEFATHSDSFWRESVRHILLAIGSLGLAFAIGLPVGIVCYRFRSVRNSILNLLNIIQTIPSIALFGLLIAPLGWIALNVPGAAQLGIRGIGAAPAFIALVLYALLPIVANTVSGLTGVNQSVRDAARGLGMTRRQLLWRVELPIAIPAILSAVRIVLVQNIGMATIAALIGGGGLGVFVFQGIGQTATDLVLLGALPTVALALSAAVIMDAITELASRSPTETADA